MSSERLSALRARVDELLNDPFSTRNLGAIFQVKDVYDLLKVAERVSAMVKKNGECPLCSLGERIYGVLITKHEMDCPMRVFERGDEYGK